MLIYTHIHANILAIVITTNICPSYFYRYAVNGDHNVNETGDTKTVNGTLGVR